MTMRVLLVIPKYYGAPWQDGVKCIARRLVSYLRSKRHEVIVVSAGHGASTERIGEYGEKIYYAMEVEDLRNKDRRLWIRGRLWLSMINLARRVMHENEPDVALLFASGSLFLGLRAAILKSVLGGRLVLYVTGLNNPIFGTGWLIPDLKVIVGSPFLLRWFPNATVAYPATPIHFKADRRSNSFRHPSSPLSLLYLGTAQRERGVEYLLKGVAIARGRTQCQLRLTLCLNGTGEENHDDITRQIAGLALNDIVSVHGIVDSSQAYRCSDVVVIPRQKPTRMSFPVRIIEALSFQKPLIVTSMCDMGRLAEGSALVVDPRSPDDLAKAIVKLAEDHRLYQRLSDECASLMRKYEPGASLDIIYSVLRNMAHRPG